MIRVAHIGDQHFNLGSRWEESQRIFRWIARDIAERSVDLVVLGGDLFERRPQPAESRAAAEWLISLAETAPVRGVYGNHDVPFSLDVFNKLETKHSVRFTAVPEVEVVAGVALAMLPWPRKASLLQWLGREVSSEQANTVAQESLRDVLRWLGMQLDEHDAPRLAVGHVMISGAETDRGQPLVGCDLEVSLADLGLMRAEFVACSHVHAQNDWTWNEAPIVYAGAPYRCNYGENGAKGYVIVDFYDGACPPGERVLWRRVATPAQPMVLLEGCYADGQLEVEAGHGFAGDMALVVPDADIPGQPGADVRLRYEVMAPDRDAGRHAAQEKRRELLETWGADRVTVEEVVVQTTRARAPEIAEATTPAEKLRLLWSQRGAELGEREPRVLGRLQQLEEAS